MMMVMGNPVLQRLAETRAKYASFCMEAGELE